MKRIVHLSTAHPVSDVRVFMKECRSLARMGYDVTIVTPHEGNETIDGVKIIGIPMRESRLSRMVFSTHQVYKIARKLDADLYHFHMIELLVVGLMLSWHGKTVVYDIHEDHPRELLNKHYIPSGLKKSLSWLVERFENFVAARCSGLVAATPTIGARFEQTNAKTVVVNNFPLQEEFAAIGSLPMAERPPAVTFVGRLCPERGLYEIIEAMSLLPADPQAALELAGPYASSQYEAAVRHIDGWQFVDELGTISRAQVAELFARVRAGLVTFHPSPNNIDSMPNKLFEYMAAGLPVIASDFPHWRDIIDTHACGLLVDPQSSQETADAIAYLLEHPDEAEAMGRRGREAVEQHFNWQCEERTLRNFYDELLVTDKS